jgi:hypothetical protein
MGTAIKDHVREKFRLVNLTSLGTGDSDANRDFVFHKIGQVIIGAIAGGGFLGNVPFVVGPKNAIIYQKKVDRMTLGVGDLSELKASCRFLFVILAEYK